MHCDARNPLASKNAAVAAVGHWADIGHTENDMHQVRVAYTAVAAHIADYDQSVVHDHTTDDLDPELQLKNVVLADVVVPLVDEVRSYDETAEEQ